MGKLEWDGAALLAPVPAVLVTCGSMEQANVLTIAWTGICATHPPTTYISVRPSRYSHALLKKTGKFAINLTTGSLCRAVDFCGVRSGRDTDKIAACGLHLQEGAEGVPILEESPLSLICRVTKVIPLGSHDMFLAEIVHVAVEEHFLNAQGQLKLEQAGLLAYAHGRYYTLGKELGKFGFSVKKKRPHSTAKKRSHHASPENAPR